MVRAGENLVTIEKNQVDGKDNLVFRLDKSKIMTVGKEAIGNFIKVYLFLYIFRIYKFIKVQLMWQMALIFFLNT